MVSQPIAATLLWQPPKEGLGRVVQALRLPAHLHVTLISSGFDVSSGHSPDVRKIPLLFVTVLGQEGLFLRKCFSRNLKGLLV